MASDICHPVCLANNTCKSQDSLVGGTENLNAQTITTTVATSAGDKSDLYLDNVGIPY